jgi:hypothetical protein
VIKFLEYELRDLVRREALVHDGFTAELFRYGLPVAKVSYDGDGLPTFISWLDKDADHDRLEADLIAWHQKVGSWHWGYSYRNDSDAAINLLVDILANNKLACENIVFRPTSAPDSDQSGTAPEQIIAGKTLLNYPSLIGLSRQFPDAVVWNPDESTFVGLHEYLSKLPLVTDGS